MPKRTFPKLAELLISHGLDPNTPALLAESVSLSTQELKHGTLASLAQDLTNEITTAPGVILLGPLTDTPQL